MSKFADDFESALRDSILKQVRDVRLVDQFPKERKRIPQEIVDRIWEQLDWDEIVRVVSEKIQDSIAASITNSMITEAKTDVKAVLSIQGVRQRLRAEAYPKIMQVLNDHE